MNGSPELLEFYLVEATEYVDALDRLVSHHETFPDPNALLATARALRGSSTMARVDGVGELSLALEQIAVRARDDEVPWSSDLYRSLRGCVEDLRFLVRGVRVWSEPHQRRCDERLSDLRRHLPVEPRRATPPPTEATTPVFVALQAAAIAAGIEAFLGAPEQRRTLDDAVGRARMLQGIAGIGAFPPLADVADAVERAARRLLPDAPITDEERELFQAAGAVLARAADQLRAAGSIEPPAVETARLARAVRALETPSAPPPPVVRIDQLFYADEGPHVVARSGAPPMSADQRLHQELVARAEHLQRLVGDARGVVEAMSRARIARELLGVARDLEATAASFGAHQTAAFFAQMGREPDLLDPRILHALDRAALGATQPFEHLEELEQRLAVVQREQHQTPATGLAAVPAGQGRRPTPTGRELQQLLATGLAGLSSLESEPLVAPAPVESADVVPIDDLLYSGDGALRRAIELRDTLREGQGRPEEALEELFDLLDLARSR
jgi:chemotaxis protein histidine kinase CheA